MPTGPAGANPSPTWVNQFRRIFARGFQVLFDTQPVPAITLPETSALTSTMALQNTYTSTMQ